jgi:hypothetical protein
MEDAKPCALPARRLEQRRETPVARQGAVARRFVGRGKQGVVGPDGKTVALADHIDARRRAIVIVDAMRSAGRIDDPTDHDVVASDPNGEVSHQVHCI